MAEQDKNERDTKSGQMAAASKAEEKRDPNRDMLRRLPYIYGEKQIIAETDDPRFLQYGLFDVENNGYVKVYMTRDSAKIFARSLLAFASTPPKDQSRLEQK